MGKIITQKKAELARILGEADDIKIEEPRWLGMMEKGVIVELHLSRWRGRTTLDLGDLGIPESTEDELYSHLMKLGQKRLLPQANIKGRKVSYVDILDNVDTLARRNLERHSYATHWGRFVPHTMYSDWKRINEEYRDKYYAIRDEICDKYEEILEQLRAEYGTMARAAYRRQTALQGGYMEEVDFINRFCSRVMALVPSRETIRASFDYSVEIRFIPLPSTIQKDIAKADKIKLQTEADRANIQSLQAMNQDVVNQAKAARNKMVEGFLEDVAKQIRGLTYEVTTNVLESLKKNEALVGKASVQLSNLVTNIRALNFYDDREMEAMSRSIEDIIGTDIKDRDIAEIRGKLQDIGILTRASLIALGDAPRSGRAVGIPAIPQNGLVRNARRGLGLEAEEIQADFTRKGGRS